jgi:hypothetical protein
MVRSNGGGASWHDGHSQTERIRTVNFFAHAYQYLDDPYFVVGSGVPDWLSMADRDVRVRIKHVRPFEHDRDRVTASIARGVVRHIEDDAQFHSTRAFAELSLDLTGMIRRDLDADSDLRSSFLAHLLVEVLLDDNLIARDPGELDRYYKVMDSVDMDRVQATVNRMARGTTERLAGLIRGFNGHRVLSDYARDDKLFVRLNQVMRRINCAVLPETFCRILPEIRRKVDFRADELLVGVRK